MAYTEHAIPGLQVAPFDKVLHFVLAGALALSLDGSLGWRCVRHIPVAAVVVIACTGSEEIAQRFSASKSSYVPDFLADCAGVLAAMWIARHLRKPVERTRGTSAP